MADPSNVGDAFRRYLDAGLSVIPLGLRSKRPAFNQLPIDPDDGEATFKPFMQRYARLEEIERWVRGGAYPGILAGKISGWIFIYDFDDTAFCEWLLSNPIALRFLQKTWTVRSGSGKIHVYLRDDGSHTPPGRVMLGTRKLGDVRVTGNYAVAPPSLHEDNGEPYTTLFGSPENILLVQDTYAVIMGLVSILGAPEQPESTNGRTPAGPNTITPPADAKGKQAMLTRLGHEKRVIGKVKRAIKEGVLPGEGEWIELDRSKISSDVVAALMDAGWSFEDVDLVLASFPIGSLTYRNSQRRGSYGRAWLTHTWREKEAVFKSRQASAGIAQGLNFETLRGDCEIWPEGRIWKLLVKSPTTGPEGAPLVVKEPDLKTYSGWVSACVKYLGFYPMMQAAHQSQGNHHLFVTAVMNACAASKPPEEATSPGRLKGTIVELAAKNIFGHVPEKRGQWVLGWRDQHYAYLLPSELSTRLSTMSKVAPGDRDVHEAMNELGGVWAKARWGEQMEHPEQMWRLPLHVVTGEPHRNGTS